MVGAATPQWFTQLKTVSGQENLKNSQFELSAQINTEFCTPETQTQISTQRTLEHKKEL